VRTQIACLKDKKGAAMNQDTVMGKWKEIKGEISRTWANLNKDEIKHVKGDLTELAGTIQEKYGEAKEEVTKKLSEIVNRFTAEKPKQPPRGYDIESEAKTPNVTEKANLHTERHDDSARH
jgi:uncharacterized protein YjbJ (UPF0337 family)